MNITKRDIADIVLVWMAISFLTALLTSIVALGTYIGMTQDAIKYTDKSTAIMFSAINVLALLFLNYIILFKRAPLLSLVFPDGKDKELSIPSGLVTLTSYAFWIRLFGIFTFLSYSIKFLDRLTIDIAAKREFVTQSFWIHSSGIGLVPALLAIIVVWKSDWIAAKLERLGSSNKVPEPTSAPRASDVQH